jgi:hypothetical protein
MTEADAAFLLKMGAVKKVEEVKEEIEINKSESVEAPEDEAEDKPKKGKK